MALAAAMAADAGGVGDRNGLSHPCVLLGTSGHCAQRADELDRNLLALSPALDWIITIIL